ncbi:MAG: hypothetical protein H5T86_07870, partial [Armatimonadetes bacterium]|nr:hypothetical protein [Armatimonadota bacterium]
APLLPTGEDFHDVWAGSNGREALELFNRHGVLAAITGHWHRVGEWQAHGLRVINTGALVGWQWTGIPPHYCFPVRPGYRLFWFGGGWLRTFWREGSYWMKEAPRAQVWLEWIGEVHTGGPRPQVRSATVSAPTRLVAKAFVLGGRVEAVEFSAARERWESMEPVFEGLWSEWEISLDPSRLRPGGPYPLCVRAVVDGKVAAYDAVPVSIAERESGVLAPSPATPGPEFVWELFYKPDGE